MSTLSFNVSVSDKHNLSVLGCPFQIMPSTQTMLYDRNIDNYEESKNNSILIHMNYITRPFSERSIEANSLERKSLQQYVKLANKLGTRNILIHGPSNVKEYENLIIGMKVIKDEIIDKNMIIHIEIPSWTNELVTYFKNKNADFSANVLTYVDSVMIAMSSFPDESYYLVPDTAHMYANGCKELSDFTNVLDKYSTKIQYIHLNGNIQQMFKSDIHCPMFSKNNKIECVDELSQYCADMDVICIAENTKNKSNYDEWSAYANKHAFKLVEYNGALAL